MTKHEFTRTNNFKGTSEKYAIVNLYHNIEHVILNKLIKYFIYYIL